MVEGEQAHIILKEKSHPFVDLLPLDRQGRLTGRVVPPHIFEGQVYSVLYRLYSVTAEVGNYADFFDSYIFAVLYLL